MVLILNKDITEAAWLRRRNPRFKLREQVSGLPGITRAVTAVGTEVANLNQVNKRRVSVG